MPEPQRARTGATTAGVVETCHELLKWLIPRLDDFPRNRRFTLGAQLEQGVLGLLRLLVEAAYSRDKVPLLQRANCWPRDARASGLAPMLERGSQKRPWLIGLCLGTTIGLALHPAPVVAWTEQDLQAAERILDLRVAEAKAEAEANAKAKADADLGQAKDSIPQGMVKIPAGSFQMGCSPGGRDCYDDEKPPHAVQVRAFRMGKYEVTQAQWRAVMGANPSRFEGDERPMEQVSWDDAQTFLSRLNAGNSGKPYRLPTEAEWEYAARGGTQDRYWWGKDIGKGKANCAGCGSQWDNKETAPVGSFPANPFGLYDTVGNVWEWVQDCSHSTYQGAPADGSGWHANCQGASRVLRGGSWNYNPGTARVSNRFRGGPAGRSDDYGLRLAQDL